MVALLPLLASPLGGLLELTGNDPSVRFSPTGARTSATLTASCDGDKASVKAQWPSVIELKDFDHRSTNVTSELMNVRPTCVDVPYTVPCHAHHPELPKLWHCNYHPATKTSDTLWSAKALETKLEEIRATKGELLALTVRIVCPVPPIETLLSVSAYAGTGSAHIALTVSYLAPKNETIAILLPFDGVPDGHILSVVGLPTPPAPPASPPPPAPPVPPSPPPPSPQSPPPATKPSCKGQSTGPVSIELTSGAVKLYCNADYEGGGWTLLEKAKSGSNAVTVTDGAISLDGLANTNSADAKTSTADLKAFMKAGSGEMLWVNKDDNHFVLLQYSDSFIDNWSAGFRYNGGNRVFTYYDWNAKTRKSCNGHINNVHWSTYCDSGGAQKALAKNYVTGSTSSKYWNFHTDSSKKANANFLFYFR